MGTDLHVLKARMGADLAVLADDRRTLKPRARIDHGVAADDDIDVDIGRIGIHECHTLCHQRLILAAAQDLLRGSELGARVDAERFLVVVGHGGKDLLALLSEDFEHVGQIVLALCIVIFDLVQSGEKVRRFKAIDARIDLAHGALLLRRVLVLDDSFHRAVCGADDAAISRRIGHDGGQNGRLRARCRVFFRELLEELPRQERRVAAEHENRALFLVQQRFRLQDGMPRAELLFLRDEIRLTRKRLFHRLAAESHDDYIAHGTRLLRGREHMGEHRLAARLVQHLRQRRLHARPLARRQYDCCQICHSFSLHCSKTFPQHRSQGTLQPIPAEF